MKPRFKWPLYAANTLPLIVCIVLFCLGLTWQDASVRPPNQIEKQIAIARADANSKMREAGRMLLEARAAQDRLNDLLDAYYLQNRTLPDVQDPDTQPDPTPVDPAPGRLGAPPLLPVADATIIVEAGGARYVDASRGSTRPSSGYQLAEALRMAAPGDVIGVDGDFSGQRPMVIGGGIKGGNPARAFWTTSAIRDVTIVGLNPGRSDSIGTIEFWDKFHDGSESGGVDSIRFENLTIRASKYTSTPVFVPKGQTVGRIQIYDCTIAGNADGRYEGFGQKWGIRSAGRATWDIRDTHCKGAQEHFAYLDSPQGDNYFVGLTMEASWRTMIQIVNRMTDNPGPPSSGNILVEDCHARGIKGDGGSAFTVAGHLGAYVLRNCTVRDSAHGAFVAYTETDPAFGVALFTGVDGNAYSTRYLEIDGLEVDLPNADRSHVQVSGVERFVLRNFLISGNQTALDLDTRFGSAMITGEAFLDGVKADMKGTRILNGSVDIQVEGEPSRYPGWDSHRKVVRDGSTISADSLLGRLDPETL